MKIFESTSEGEEDKTSIETQNNDLLEKLVVFDVNRNFFKQGKRFQCGFLLKTLQNSLAKIY